MTKIWRKNEWEKMSEDLQSDPNFYNFVKKMYQENTFERQSEGRTPYNNVFDYYRKYPDWLFKKYTENINKGLS
jgi:hypothetical protein